MQDPASVQKSPGDPSSASLICPACNQRSNQGEIYSMGSATVCPRCSDGLVQAPSPRIERATFLRALRAGVLAAAFGAIVHLVIVSVTGAEYGFAAIGVGLLVGGAVRKAACGQGGWRLQVLAMALTYVAVVAGYTPDVMKGVVVGLEQAAKERAADPKQKDSCNAPATDSGGAKPGTESCPPLSMGEVAVGLVLLSGIVVVTTLAVPWLIVFESPLCLLILLAAVYQAFRMNAPVRPRRHGPYRLSSL